MPFGSTLHLTWLCETHLFEKMGSDYFDAINLSNLASQMMLPKVVPRMLPAAMEWEPPCPATTFIGRIPDYYFQRLEVETGAIAGMGSQPSFD